MEKQIDFDHLESFTDKYNIETEVVQRTKLISQLVKLREDAGLTPRELGEEVGLTETQVLEIEKGIHIPKLSTVLKLANYYDKGITLATK